jgi:hypothetical protein
MSWLAEQQHQHATTAAQQGQWCSFQVAAAAAVVSFQSQQQQQQQQQLLQQRAFCTASLAA